ncbi:MAG: hypothetical protein D6751_11370 [Deltaproteobacteria bacterium]|nr:MAG: hypothetical protein D6751_11370 [Deltaproteobacteria bacterium]
MLLKIPCLLCLAACLWVLPATASDQTTDLQSLAIERYRQALAVDPDNNALRYVLGVSLLGQNRYEEAVRELKVAYPAYIDSVEANYNLALALVGSGDADSALLYLQQAEDLGAAEQADLYPIAAIYFNIALKQLNGDRLEDAAALLRHVLDLPGPKVETHRLLGDIYMRLNDSDRAEGHWLEVLRAAPNDPVASDYLFTIRYNRGLELLEKNPEKAGEQFRAALEVNPEAALPHYYLAYLAYRSQDCVTTLEQLEQARIGLPETTRESLAAMAFNCAARLLDQNRPEAARPAVALLAESKATEVQAHFLAGNIHLALEEYADARAEYLAVLRQDPGHTGANLNLLKADQGTSDRLFEQGRNLYRRGAYRQAIARLQECLAINPAYPMARDYLDQSRSDLESSVETIIADAERLVENDPEQALTQIDRGLDLDPGNSRLRDLRERATQALGQRIDSLLADAATLAAAGSEREATELYRQVLTLAPDHTGAKEGLALLEKRRNSRAADFVATADKALDRGDIQAAVEAYRAALAIDPDNPGARAGYEKADALLDSLVSEELRWARRARQANQRARAASHYLKALALREKPEIRQEFELFQKENDQLISELAERCEAALARGDLRAARQLWQKLRQLAPESMPARRLGEALRTTVSLRTNERLEQAGRQLEDGSFDLALASYRAVLELDPENREAQAGIIRVRGAMKNRLSELLVQAESAIGAGRYADADKLLARTRTLDPYNSRVRSLTKRLSSLRRSGLTPEDARRLYLEGIDLYTRGQYRQAISAWQQVLTLDPNHERARSNIAKAERKLAQIESIRQ